MASGLESESSFFSMAQIGDDFGTASLEGREIAITVKWNACLPDPVENPNPAASELSYRRVVLHATISQHSITSFGPRTPLSGAVGELVKGLPKVFRAGVSPSDLPLPSTLPRHRCDAAKGGQFIGVLPTVALGTKGTQQPRRKRLAGAPQACE